MAHTERHAFSDRTGIRTTNLSAEQNTYNIENNAFMFRILSDSMYRDKILAVIREYRNNAIDAHVETGQTKPVDIHLPTNIEPWFEVKDYGTGLSPDEIVSLFTTYGASDKRTGDAITQIGGFGLGSKAAFAYTDQFTVSSRYNGKQHTYVCVIENGFPKVTHAGTVPTKEPNGLTVTLAVNISDVSTFRNRYERIRTWCDVVDNVNIPITVPEQNLVISGTGWCVLAPVLDGAVVKLGNVAYRIDWSAIPNSDDDKATFANSGLVLEFGPKDLSPAPSREDLSYDPMTVGRLRSRLAVVRKELRDNLAKELESCATKFEAWRKFNAITSSTRLFAREKFATWRGLAVIRGTITSVLTDATTFNHKLVDYTLHLGRTKISVSCDTALTVAVSTYEAPAFKGILYGGDNAPEPYRMSTEKLKQRISDACSDKLADYRNYIIVTGPLPLFYKVLRDLGNPPHAPLRDFVESIDEYNERKRAERAEARANSAPRTKHIVQPYKLYGDIVAGPGSSRMRVKVSIDMANDPGGLYVVSKNGAVDNPMYINAVLGAKVVDYTSTPVYVVPVSISKAFEDSPKFTELTKHSIPLVKAYLEKYAAAWDNISGVTEPSGIIKTIISILGIDVGPVIYSNLSWDQRARTIRLKHMYETLADADTEYDVSNRVAATQRLEKFLDKLDGYDIIRQVCRRDVFSNDVANRLAKFLIADTGITKGDY